MTSYVWNIVAVYDAATDADIAAGLGWYPAAHRIALTVGNGELERGAGVLAALSPQTSWKENIHRAMINTRSKQGSFRKGHLRFALRKGALIHRGAKPLTVLRGRKERAFFAAIVSEGQTAEVCVDRHAMAVCLGRQATDAERAISRGPKGDRTYNAYAEAYRTVARGTPYTPAQLQAICWVAWRRLNGVSD